MSSSERLALDRMAVTPSSDATLRTLADRRGHLEGARLRAEEHLAEAEAKLAQLSWRGRRRNGPELRSEIGMRRAALRIAAQQLAEMPRVTVPEILQRADRALERTPSRERVLTRSRAPSREPHGLDL